MAPNAEKDKRSNINFGQMVKQNARRVDVDALQKKGVKSMNVISLSKINSLINVAVEKVTRGGGLSKEREQEIKRQAQQEFMELLSIHQKTKQEKQLVEEQKHFLEEEVNKLRGLLESAGEHLADGIGGVKYEFSEEAIEDLRQKIKRMVGDLINQERRERLMGDDPASVKALGKFEKSLKEIVENVLSAEKEKARLWSEEQEASQVSLLQRRLSKLQGQLSKTESSLKKLAKMKSIDPGVASIYDEIQGLSLEEDGYEKKKEMLKVIFEDNLKLQNEKKAATA